MKQGVDMTKMYLIRHCEAEGNKARCFQGVIDLDITEVGAKQLEHLTKRFEPIQIDRAYSSPLKRAYKTAVAAVGSKGIPVEVREDLIEINGGIFENVPFQTMFTEHPDVAKVWHTAFHLFAPEGGEPMTAVYERSYRALLSIAQDPANDGKTLIVASHGGFIKAFLCRLIYGNIEKLTDVPWPTNTSVSLVTYEDGAFHLEFSNDDSHLPDELLPLDPRGAKKIELYVGEN